MGIVKPTREGPWVVVVLPTELTGPRSVIYTLNVPDEMHETSLIQQLFPGSFTKVRSTYSFQTEVVDKMSTRIKGYPSPGRGLPKFSGAFGIPVTVRRIGARVLEPQNGCDLTSRD